MEKKVGILFPLILCAAALGSVANIVLAQGPVRPPCGTCSVSTGTWVPQPDSSDPVDGSASGYHQMALVGTDYTIVSWQNGRFEIMYKGTALPNEVYQNVRKAQARAEELAK